VRYLLPLVLLLVLTLSTHARPQQAPYKSETERVALVKKGKLSGFFNPKDLSQPPVLSAPSALLMDFDTGEVLYESGADDRHYPASTTKILTALLFIENTKPDDIVVCTDPNIGQIEPSSLGIKPGERFRAEQLLYGFLLRSANDGGVVIAEHVGGSVAGFAQKMNARAALLGATNSHFANPHGLHNPDHYTTARDLALIARAALQNPRFAAAVGTPRRTITRSINFKDVVVTSKAKRWFYDKVPGADGVKTGYTKAAAHCFVGSATRGGRRLIAVVLAAPSNAIGDTAPLLEWGFRRFPTTTVATVGQHFGFVPTKMGSAPQVATEAAQALHIPYDSLTPERVETKIEPTQNVAPIAAGQEVARLVVWQGGKKRAELPLLAVKAVPRSVVRATARSPWPWLLTLGGAGALFLIRYRHGLPNSLGTLLAPRPPAKGHRRRRSGVAPTRRDLDRNTSRSGQWGDRHREGGAGGPQDRQDPR